jgi:hypothetical protein
MHWSARHRRRPHVSRINPPERRRAFRRTRSDHAAGAHRGGRLACVHAAHRTALHPRAAHLEPRTYVQTRPGRAHHAGPEVERIVRPALKRCGRGAREHASVGGPAAGHRVYGPAHITLMQIHILLHPRRHGTVELYAHRHGRAHAGGAALGWQSGESRRQGRCFGVEAMAADGHDALARNGRALTVGGRISSKPWIPNFWDRPRIEVGPLEPVTRQPVSVKPRPQASALGAAALHPPDRASRSFQMA